MKVTGKVSKTSFACGIIAVIEIGDSNYPTIVGLTKVFQQFHIGDFLSNCLKYLYY